MVTAEKGGSTSIQQKLRNIDSARASPLPPANVIWFKMPTVSRLRAPPGTPVPAKMLVLVWALGIQKVSPWCPGQASSQRVTRQDQVASGRAGRPGGQTKGKLSHK